jgi:hypothetical protein
LQVVCLFLLGGAQILFAGENKDLKIASSVIGYKVRESEASEME